MAVIVFVKQILIVMHVVQTLVAEMIFASLNLARIIVEMACVVQVVIRMMIFGKNVEMIVLMNIIQELMV